MYIYKYMYIYSSIVVEVIKTVLFLSRYFTQKVSQHA